MRRLLGLLTGPVGVGKTTIAGRVVDLARRRGIACKGLLAPALYDASGRKTAIVGFDLETGERRTLARTDCELGGPQLGPYSFDAAALGWATGVVLDALGYPPFVPAARVGEAKAEGEPPLVVVDEIGKLELWHGLGLAPVLPALADGVAAWVLIIVRESLLEELQAQLAEARQVVFWASEQNRDALPEAILETFAGAEDPAAPS